MNRLVIIGNGFDLAHGLPTSYRDFIDDFWRNIQQNYRKEEYKKFVNINEDYFGLFEMGIINNFNDFKKNLVLYSNENDCKYSESTIRCYSKRGDSVMIKPIIVFEFKNSFFKAISLKNTENWVDIENEYYKLLKECVKQNDNSNIVELNREFEELKLLFEKYLIEKVEENYVFSKDVVEKFINIFDANRYEKLELDRFFMEISKQTEIFLVKEHKDYLNKNRPDNGYHPSDDISHKVDVEHHFLSFNYTSTVFNYIKALDLNLYNLNEIHGRLEDERNLINFGFGDEMDKHYQEIEEKDDNEYLKNIKSFQYLHTPNYKRLLNLIDSDKFQVYIMGHSCGLSDRTLLNTIFEHENCCSIKIFFHEILNEQGEVIKDNYTEITQNISRHFNKKKLMREKIVNKTLCEALPQVKLPLYK
jgi:hypothetical protein